MTLLQAYRTSGIPISPDFPIGQLSEDGFGRVEIAMQLADMLARLQSKAGVVVGLEGEWGSGKTSLLNLLPEIVAKEPGTYGSPVIARFNPWWFSRKDDLAFRFFQQVGLQIYGSGKKEAIALAHQLIRIGKAIQPLLAPGPAGAILDALDTWLGTSKEHKSLDQLRNDLSRQLVDDKVRLWIVIDDVDRLFPTEVLQILALIRGLGELPNVYYILAYDRRTLAKRIDHALGTVEDAVTSGSEYLEKIIQIAFPVPPYPAWQMAELLEAGLLESFEIDTLPEDLVADVQQLWWEVLSEVLKTPRDVRRLIASMRTNYPFLKEDVHPIDYLGVQTLRTFFSATYHSLPKCKSLLLGSGRSELRFGDEDAEKRAAAELVSLESRLQHQCQRLLRWLFPPLTTLLDEYGSRYGSTHFKRWSDERRVCSASSFDTYFELQVPAGTLSAREVEELVDSLADANILASLLDDAYSRLVPPFGFPRSFLYVRQLASLHKSIDAASYEPTFLGLYKNADDYSKPGHRIPGFFRQTLPELLAATVIALGSRLRPGDFFSALRELFNSSQSILSIAYLLRRLRKDCSPDGVHRRPCNLTQQHMAELVSVLGPRLAAKMLDLPTFFDHPESTSALLAWKEIEEPGVFRDFIQSLLATIDGARVFMSVTRTQITVSSGNERGSVTRSHRKVSRDLVAALTEPNVAIERLTALRSESNEPDFHSQVDEFLEELDSSDD